MSTMPEVTHDSAEMQALRDAYVAAENARLQAWERLKEANKNSPLWREFNAATERKKAAQEAYSRALQNQKTESPIMNAEQLTRLRLIEQEQEKLIARLIELRAEEDAILQRQPWSWQGRPDKRTGPRRPKAEKPTGRDAYFRPGHR